MFMSRNMENYLAVVCVAFVLATFVDDVSPCMFPRDWKEAPLSERITAADTVILGYVETLYPSKETKPIHHSNNTVTHLPRYYTAKIVLKCAFHGRYSKTIQPSFNLTAVNTGSSCKATTTLKKHQSYIFLLEGSLSQTELAPMEINYQTAAVNITEPSMEVIRTKFGYEIIQPEPKKHPNMFICQAAASPDQTIKRMDPAMVIGDKKGGENGASAVTHFGLLSLVGAFLISVLF